jgi:ATP-dependent RNA helicase RhlB
MADQLLTELRYSELPLAEPILRGTQDAGFDRCTPIQAETLPLALRGEDVAGQAQTGTGKTAAFLVACLQLLTEREPLENYKEGNPRAIVLAPTRELAVQIYNDAVVLGAHTGFRVGVVYGGTGYDTQRQMLVDGVEILIGTPGRFLDYFKQGVFNLNGVQVAIMDEADRMFDLGFIKDIRYLLRRLPPASDRVNMLFSATLSFRVTELAYEHMNDPTLINTSPDEVTVKHVTQVLYHVSKEEKVPLLLGLMEQMEVKRTIVFTNTKRAAEMVTDSLNANGFKGDMLSGDVPQKKRLRLLGEFQDGNLPVLVATDVAARGLHIPEVSHVFNFDLPQDAEDYVHRIGRTARAGARGDAITFACEEFVYSLQEIETYIGGQLPVEQVTDEMLKPDLIVPPRRPRPPRKGAGGPGGGRGRRDGGGSGGRRRP